MIVAAPLRDLLIRLDAVSPAQWDSAAELAGDDHTATLRIIAARRAWWAPDGVDFPGLTAWQLQQLDKPDAERRLRWGSLLVLDRIGEGGMGVVYRGWDLAERRWVAIKRLRSDSKEKRVRFRREADLLSRLDHPSIARCFGLVRVDGFDAIVMEYVPGQTLYSKVMRLKKAGKGLGWRQVARWALDAVDALEHLHSREIVHRDVKPGNIMIRPDGRLKLLDLGLAKLTRIDDPMARGVTVQGQVLGTCDYMPLEQWDDGRAVTAAADLYALGATLHFAFTGEPPHRAVTGYQLLQSLGRGDTPTVRDRRPDVSAAFDELLQTLLAREPSERGTARDLKWRIGRLLNESSISITAKGDAPTATLAAKPTQCDQSPRWIDRLADGLRRAGRAWDDWLSPASPATRVARRERFIVRCRRGADHVRRLPWRDVGRWLTTGAALTAATVACLTRL
ncbi:MAG: serine/threonine protein kinase [Gemmataceae bacterium]|nr:serine/threonine protein kinase [Gemmataceae bacterium]